MRNLICDLPPASFVFDDLLEFQDECGDSVSDKLSETLARHTVVLDNETKHKELSLRQQLLEGIANFDDCRENEGRIFFEYCEIYKAQRLWTKVATEIGLRFGYSLKTVERMRDKHMEKLGLRKTRTTMPKRSSKSLFEGTPSRAVSRECDELLVSRYHIREALAPFPGLRLVEVLTHLIEAESFSSWGLKKPFTMHIVPRATPIMILAELCDEEAMADESVELGEVLESVN
jgi:hypothetical protein